MSDTEELRQRAEQYNHQLLTSEDQYVNELETIVKYIVHPLQKAAVRCKIRGGEEEVKKVFHYPNAMLMSHVTFLSVIRETISVIPDMYKYIGFVQIYIDYFHNYDKILHIFANWRSMEFREFVSMRLKHKDVKQHIINRLDSLPWYLYRPFDRIKEYHRFLKDIQKITQPKQHHNSQEIDEYNLIKKTIAKIRPLYKKIKSHEDRLQQKTRLLEVQLQIHGYNKTLVEDDRFFVYNRQCQMKRRGLPGKKYKHIQIYLFNDLFIWVSARGRFKGSYSFYKENLQIAIPSHCKKGDALFSIGLPTEKHKREIVCADDLQRDKLMNTIIRTYKQCQEKYIKTMNGNNTEAIKMMKKKQIRETIGIDLDLSASSIDTRNTSYNNQEYSVSNISANSDRTDITEAESTLPKISEAKEILLSDSNTKKRHDHNWNRRSTNHLKGPAEDDPRCRGMLLDDLSQSIDDSLKIPLNVSPDVTPTPDPSQHALGHDLTPQHSMDSVENLNNGYHKPQKREEMKQLQDELINLQKELKMKDDRIRDLEESNKAIRQTLILKDHKIESLQDQVHHLNRKMTSHNARAKSISNTLRQTRVKRAASFSIGKGGKITRTAMLPSQIHHNQKIKAAMRSSPNTFRNRTMTPRSNGHLHTPRHELQRAHSENANHRKAKSEKYILAK
eukprot:480959_1